VVVTMIMAVIVIVIVIVIVVVVVLVAVPVFDAGLVVVFVLRPGMVRAASLRPVGGMRRGAALVGVVALAWAHGEALGGGAVGHGGHRGFPRGFR